MIRKLLVCIAITLTAYGAEKEFPRMIDFNVIELKDIPGSENCDIAEMNTYFPFNNAPELGPFFAYLRDTYQIRTAVETGTFQGNTTKFLAYLFDTVYTSEIDVCTFNATLKAFEGIPNIVACYGNSPDVLRQILPGLSTQRLLFYLDAHWEDKWPLLEEISTIAQSHRDNCIIVVDDFRVPSRLDIPFDRYGKHACAYNYIRSTLAEVYSEYNYYYLIPKNVQCRAKFLAIPKKWKN